MQPETAFWLLSTTAQSSAALAGLAALLWVFFRQARKEVLGFGLPKEDRQTQRWAWLLRGSSLSVLFFVFALALSLATLAFVDPGDAPVALFIVVLAWVSLGLTAVGGLNMFSFVWFAERNIFHGP